MSTELAQARAYIDNLDLSYIVKKMCSPHYFLPRWPEPLAQQCCQLYKNFLYIKCKNRGVAVVPTRDIDEFWHNHILYTRQYNDDCLAIFGHYLHHDPADPDEDDMGELRELFMVTKSLYEQEFGESLQVLVRH